MITILKAITDCLRALYEGNINHCCHAQRQFNKSIKLVTSGLNDKNSQGLIDSTSCMLQSSRLFLAAFPKRLSISQRCELSVMRDDVHKCLALLEGTEPEFKILDKSISSLMDSIEDAWSTHYLSMSHEDYNDDSYAFPYLMILSNLNAIVSGIRLSPGVRKKARS